MEYFNEYHDRFKPNEYEYNDSISCSGIDEPHDKYYGAVAPALIQTSLFVPKDYQSYCDDMLHEAERYIYSRGLNPTVEMLEKKLAKLELGAACKCFSSGMGAISATLFATLNQGEHIILVNNIYGPTIALIKKMSEKYGVEFDIIFCDNASEIAKSIKPNTKAIYTESPATMTMKLIDLSAIAKQHNIVTIIDNTWSTPIFQKPITLGFDIVIHSCTKYIGGHSDLTGGAVISSQKFIDSCQIFKIGCSWGGYESLVISPTRGYNQDDLLKSPISPGLIRVSIGHENSSLLIRDIDHALNELSKI